MANEFEAWTSSVGDGSIHEESMISVNSPELEIDNANSQLSRLQFDRK